MGRQRAEGRLGGAKIAGAIGGDRRTQRRRHVGRRVLLSARGAGRGKQHREQRHPQRDHLVLKL